jgi:hypothetical protein
MTMLLPIWRLDASAIAALNIGNACSPRPRGDGQDETAGRGARAASQENEVGVMSRARPGISSPTSDPTGLHQGARLLRYAALVYTAGFLAHNADHVRRGFDILTPEVLWAGAITGMVAVAAIALALAGHHWAALVATVHGLSQAFGVAAVHLLPRWSAFSDSLPDGNADTLSWVAVLAEIVGALAFGVAGAYALRRRREPGDEAEPARMIAVVGYLCRPHRPVTSLGVRPSQ